MALLSASVLWMVGCAVDDRQVATAPVGDTQALGSEAVDSASNPDASRSTSDPAQDRSCEGAQCPLPLVSSAPDASVSQVSAISELSSCESGTPSCPDAAAPGALCVEGTRRCLEGAVEQCFEGAWVQSELCEALDCNAAGTACQLRDGQSCELDGDCLAGSCAAAEGGGRVCCSADCSSTCQRCSASGAECLNLESDSECAAVACPTASYCHTYELSTGQDACTNGTCQSAAQACQLVPRNAGLSCDDAHLCDTQGGCTVDKGALGNFCSSGFQCLSNACVATQAGASVCCSRACGPTEVCGAGGFCEPAAVCSNGDLRCSGGDLQRCVGGQWSTELRCGARQCSVQQQGCLANAGEECFTTSDCGEGSCQASAFGRVCCTAPCEGACRQCAPSGQSCQNLDDDDACGITNCPSDTACADYPNDIRSGRCAGGRCGSAAQLCNATNRAEGTVCSATSLCDAFGNCSTPKRSTGTSCLSNAECASNFCVDGVCCNEDCIGACETCAVTGICRAPADDAACPQVLCGSFSSGCVRNSTDITRNRCVAKGQCATDDACDFLPTRTACSSATNGRCDGAGTCQAPTVNCGGFCEVFGVGEDSVCCADFVSEEPLFCTTADSCPTQFAMPVACDEHNDCDTGEVCCRIANANGGVIDCRPAADCARPPGFVVNSEVCRAPGASSAACPSGRTCVAQTAGSAFEDWGFCQ